VRGRWLDSGKLAWLPALPVYFNFHAPPSERFCQVSSNGLAAGSDDDDAAWRAMFELIERDTFMLTWLSRRPGRRIVPDASLDPGARETIRQLNRTGAQIELYALDAGVGIPVVACVGWGDGDRWPGATVALAAHGCWQTAVRKAILEQGHVGPYIRRLSREDKTKIPTAAEEVHTLVDHALFYVDPERARKLEFLGQAEDVAFGDLASRPQLDRDACLERLHAAGLRIAIANVTSPDLYDTKFRVARALGAYIQPIDFGYRMRRLGNPRLHALLEGREPNPFPHPIA
jgi:ribosomal protein S12 methylthiotransferase accessory factor